MNQEEQDRRQIPDERIFNFEIPKEVKLTLDKNGNIHTVDGSDLGQYLIQRLDGHFIDDQDHLPICVVPRTAFILLNELATLVQEKGMVTLYGKDDE